MYGEKRAKQIEYKARKQRESLAGVSNTAPLNVQVRLRAYCMIWELKQKYYKADTPLPYVSKASHKADEERIKSLEAKILKGGSDGLVDGNEVVNKNWTEAWQNDWFDGGDGWYYYKKVLPANEMTAKVLTSLKFDSNYAEIYQTADYTLKFVSEAVQYSDDDSVNHRAVQANFGRDFKVISNNVITWN